MADAHPHIAIFHEMQLSIIFLNGHLNVVDHLVQVGASINEVFSCSPGWTPLFSACSRDCLNVLDRLVELGVSINAVNRDGKTPLHFACLHDRDEIAVLCSETGRF